MFSVLAEIHQLADPSEKQGKTRSKYELVGVEIGLPCLCSVLAVGNKRLLRAKQGAPDLRFTEFGAGARLCPKTSTVDKFLFDLHSSIAETLPTELLRSYLVVGIKLNSCSVSRLILWDGLGLCFKSKSAVV